MGKTLKEYRDEFVINASEAPKESLLNNCNPSSKVVYRKGLRYAYEYKSSDLITMVPYNNPLSEAILLDKFEEDGGDIKSFDYDSLIKEKRYGEFLCNLMKDVPAFYIFREIPSNNYLRSDKKIVIKKIEILSIDLSTIKMKNLISGRNEKLYVFDANNFEVFFSKEELHDRLESLRRELLTATCNYVDNLKSKLNEINKKRDKLMKNIKDIENNYIFEEYRISEILNLEDEDLWKNF